MSVSSVPQHIFVVYAPVPVQLPICRLVSDPVSVEDIDAKQVSYAEQSDEYAQVIL